MKKLMMIPVLAFLMVARLLAQESKYQINITNNTYTKTIELSKEGELLLGGTMPDKIQIQFPDKDFDKYTIQLNRSKTSKDSSKIVYITYRCPGDLKNCLSFNISDLQNGALTLDFKNNSLYRIGNVEAGMKTVNTDSFYLRLVKEAAKAEEAKVAAKSLSFAEANIKPENYFPEGKAFYPETQPTNYKDILDKVNTYSSAKYVVINDSRPNAVPFTILKKTCSGYEVKNKVNLMEGQTLVHIVISKQDTTFTLQTNSETFFMEGKDAFKIASEGLTNPAATTTTEPATEKSAGSKAISFEELTGDAFDIKMTTNKIKVTGAAEAAKEIEALNKEINSLKAQVGGLEGDTTAKGKEIRRLQAVVAELTKAINAEGTKLKEELLSLDAALARFNSYYRNIDLREDEYQEALRKLQENMVKRLGVAFGTNGDLMEKNLKFRINTDVLPEYRQDLLNMIDGIKAKYGDAKSHVSGYKVFQQPVDVPFADQMNLKLTNNVSHTVFDKSFNVIGGMRIDFSAGLAFNGLSDPDYFLQKATYRYKELVQKVDTPSNTIHNTYTTEIKDTTGYLIGRDKPKFSYGAALFLHTYWKVSPIVNPALTVGLSFDNDKRVKIPFGASVLFNAKGVRFGITAGGVVGPVKTLSSKQVIVAPSSNTQPIEKAELPVLYAPDTEIKTYNEWCVNWMVAVHFNFGTINVSKK